ncbi:MAG: hypothetical protein ABL307_15250 [Roseitalea porphyridii]|uniref:hypothetical protein n=1 Tax=Roseitalea porphyridii TaxID=1852022 RepID=UPI0032D92C02
MTRRSLLLLSGALMAVPVAAYGGGLLACRAVPRNTPAFFAGADQQTLRIFGRAVVRRAPEYRSARRIADELGSKALLAQAHRTDCETTRRRLVAEQCSRDFADGDHMIVDGIVVSRTEALLCAMLA